MKAKCKKCEDRVLCLEKNGLKSKYTISIEIFESGDLIDEATYTVYLCPGEQEEVLDKKVFKPISKFEDENHLKQK